MFNNSTGFTMPVVPANYGYGTGGFGGGMFGGDGLWGLIVILALLGGFGGFGFGGYGGGAGGYSEVQRGFDHNSVINKLDGLTNGLSDSTYALNNAITGVQQTLCQGFNGLQAQIAGCCCDTQRAIDGINYNMATQACDIKHAINDSTRSILDFLTTDKIAALQAENASLKQNAYFAAALDARTAEIIRRTGNDCPVPAYVVQPPTQVTFPVGYGAGCGCGF